MIPFAPYPISPFQHFKHILMGLTGLAKDALHIYVALLLFFGSMALFRWRAASTWKPVLLVAAAAVAGEGWDLYEAITTRAPVSIWANVHDVWNTLLVPVAITLVVRHTGLLQRAEGVEADLHADAPDEDQA